MNPITPSLNLSSKRDVNVQVDAEGLSIFDQKPNKQLNKLAQDSSDKQGDFGQKKSRRRDQYQQVVKETLNTIRSDDDPGVASKKKKA